MKVLFIISNYPNSLNPVSGRFFQIICENLVKKGVNVDVVCFRPSIFFPFNLLYPHIKHYKNYKPLEVINGVSVHRPSYLKIPGPFKILTYIHAYVRFRKLIRKLKPDIIDLRNSFPAIPFGKFALIANELLGIKYIYTNNGINVPFDYYGLNSEEYEFFKHLLSKSAGNYTVTRELSAETAELFGFQSGNMTHPIDTVMLTHIMNEPVNKPEKFTLCFAGELSMAKGFMDLVEACRKLEPGNDIDVIAAGSKAINPFPPLPPNMTYLGRKTPAETLQIIRNSHALVLPTHMEGMPNVIKEAGYLGIPVIATRTGGNPELIGDDETRGYLFPVGDADALARCIKQVKNNYPAALVKARKLNQHIMLHYTPKRTTADLINIYHAALNN